MVLLAALYGVCRVNNMPVKFADILAVYRSQPHCRAGLVYDVLLEPAEGGAERPRGDAIHFYNRGDF